MGQPDADDDEGPLRRLQRQHPLVVLAVQPRLQPLRQRSGVGLGIEATQDKVMSGVGFGFGRRRWSPIIKSPE